MAITHSDRKRITLVGPVLLLSIILSTTLFTYFPSNTTTLSFRNITVQRVKSWDKRLAKTKWCNGVPGYLKEPGPKVALGSFPGSGNTWMRYLLQQLTGVLTGSIYTDWKLMSKDFPAGGITDGQVIAIKTHASYKKDKAKMEYDKVILLVRNPWEAAFSNFNRINSNNSHTETVNSMLNQREVKIFCEGQLKHWRNFHLSWKKEFADSDRLLIVHYEELQSNLKSQLKKISDFLRISIDEEVYECVIQNSKGKFKREKGNITAENVLDDASLIKAIEYRDSVLRELNQKY